MRVFTTTNAPSLEREESRQIFRNTRGIWKKVRERDLRRNHCKYLSSVMERVRNGFFPLEDGTRAFPSHSLNNSAGACSRHLRPLNIDVFRSDRNYSTRMEYGHASKVKVNAWYLIFIHCQNIFPYTWCVQPLNLSATRLSSINGKMTTMHRPRVIAAADNVGDK